jgi:hypothetical protein
MASSTWVRFMALTLLCGFVVIGHLGQQAEHPVEYRAVPFFERPGITPTRQPFAVPPQVIVPLPHVFARRHQQVSLPWTVDPFEVQAPFSDLGYQRAGRWLGSGDGCTMGGRWGRS